MVPASPRYVSLMLIAYNYVMFSLTFRDIKSDDMGERLGIQPSGHEHWVPTEHYLSKFSTLVALLTATLALVPVMFPRRLYATYLLPLISWNIYELVQYMIHVFLVWMSDPSVYYIVSCLVSILFHMALIIQTILYHEVLNHVVE